MGENPKNVGTVGNRTPPPDLERALGKAHLQRQFDLEEELEPETAEFQAIVQYVLSKNADLYRRLA